MDIDNIAERIELLDRTLLGILRDADKDKRLLEPRAAYQLALLRQALGFAHDAFERAEHAIGGMVRDDFKEAVK